MEHVIDHSSNVTMSHRIHESMVCEYSLSVLNNDNQLTWLHYISKATENSVPVVKSFSKVFRYENG